MADPRALEARMVEAKEEKERQIETERDRKSGREEGKCPGSGSRLRGREEAKRWTVETGFAVESGSSATAEGRKGLKEIRLGN
ncbi:hypothetical protein CRG98_037787 [Punica granatum]|uniref:Uncharacterized protein n=1 Tax=Punica granatum TaxID=22663 RepID=A0A2I0IDE7_PUNGR|nr:hypothetical protein CRG98_037787 [Punica granatum]